MSSHRRSDPFVVVDHQHTAGTAARKIIGCELQVVVCLYVHRTALYIGDGERTLNAFAGTDAGADGGARGCVVVRSCDDSYLCVCRIRIQTNCLSMRSATPRSPDGPWTSSMAQRVTPVLPDWRLVTRTRQKRSPICRYTQIRRLLGKARRRASRLSRAGNWLQQRALSAMTVLRAD